MAVTNIISDAMYVRKRVAVMQVYVVTLRTP